MKSTQTFGGFGRSNDTFLGVCYFCFFFQPKDSPNSEDVKKQQATYQALLGACPARGCRFVYHNGIKALILGSFNRNMMKIETMKSCPNGGKLTSSIFLVARSSGLGCTGIYIIFAQNRQPQILFVWQALLESESFNKPLSDEASTPQRARNPKHTMFKKSLPQHMGSP